MLHLKDELLHRGVNEGFSGGEKKRNEIFQMAMLQPKLGILDETDSGLDIDALRIVAGGVNKLRSKDNAFIVVTHYQRLLDHIVHHPSVAWTGTTNELNAGYAADGYAQARASGPLAMIFAVLFVIPLGLLGAIVAVSFRGLQNDVYLQIGLVTTMGLAAKNAILMIEFATQRREAGASTEAAASEAARLRFRPIVMTSAAFMLGAVTGQGGPPGQSVAQRVQGHPAGGPEGGIVTHRRLGFGIARQGVHPVPGQPHHRPQLPQPPVVRIRIEDRLGGVDVHLIARRGGRNAHARHLD